MAGGVADMNGQALPINDIILPPDVGVWPLAPGWWLLLTGDCRSLVYPPLVETTAEKNTGTGTGRAGSENLRLPWGSLRILQ